jgi:hypothetical protein
MQLNNRKMPILDKIYGKHSGIPAFSYIFNPILHTVWLDNHALTLKSNSAKQCGGSWMFIPDPGSRIRLFSIPDPGSRIQTASIPDEFKYFNPKKATKWFLSSKKYDQVCSSRIPDPRVKKAPNPGSQISDPDPQHCCKILFL